MLRRPDRPDPPDRHKRFRRRRRDGKACAMIEYDASVIDFLVRTHWLQEGEVADRASIGRAIGALIRDAARR
jgi:hypothetical protein